ncbi:hypothetical protein EYF80_008203 [Liparis tanakae]|uniref:Uncharacterized protein n=1 Tax=Liparis tanakae TaxID=230148 RepID=A0A4Z2IUE4_9TELE|nr:hypothetical protein EYF80_008203 [Liparis tanakae]
MAKTQTRDFPMAADCKPKAMQRRLECESSASRDKSAALLTSITSGSLVELLRRSETGPLHSDDWLTRLLSDTGLLEELRLSLLFSLSALWLDEQEPFRFFL